MEELLRKEELTEEELRKIIGGSNTNSGKGYEVTWKCSYCGDVKKTKNTLNHGNCEKCGKDGYKAIKTKWL